VAVCARREVAQDAHEIDRITEVLPSKLTLFELQLHVLDVFLLALL